MLCICFHASVPLQHLLFPLIVVQLAKARRLYMLPLVLGCSLYAGMGRIVDEAIIRPTSVALTKWQASSYRNNHMTPATGGGGFN